MAQVCLVLSGGSVSIDAVVGAPNVAVRLRPAPACPHVMLTELRQALVSYQVLYTGFGGESGQNAIVDVVFGDAPASGPSSTTTILG